MHDGSRRLSAPCWYQYTKARSIKTMTTTLLLLNICLTALCDRKVGKAGIVDHGLTQYRKWLGGLGRVITLFLADLSYILNYMHFESEGCW